MTIQQKIQNLLNEFSQTLDWESKYKKIIEKGKSLVEMPTELKTEDNLIKGCQSQVWIFATLDSTGKKMLLKADSDALIVKGLVSLLLDLFNDQPPGEILKTDLKFFEEIGLKNHLTPSRANGFNSMVKQIYNYAFAFNYLINKNN